MYKRSDFNTEGEWLEHMRLWFAGLAMAHMTHAERGNCLHDLKLRGIDPPNPRLTDTVERMIARMAYAQADAMLAERERAEGREHNVSRPN